MRKSQGKFSNINNEDDFPDLDSSDWKDVSDRSQGESTRNFHTSTNIRAQSNPRASGQSSGNQRGPRFSDKPQSQYGKNEPSFTGGRYANNPRGNTLSRGSGPSRGDNYDRRPRGDGRRGDYPSRNPANSRPQGHSSYSDHAPKPQITFGPTSVRTNHYKLNMNKIKMIYMFHLNFEPTPLHKIIEIEINKYVMDDLKSKYPDVHIITDSSRILYTINDCKDKLSEYRATITKFVKRENVDYEASIIFAKKLDILKIIAETNEDNFSEYKAALEILLKNSQHDTIFLGRGCYKPKTSFIKQIANTPFEVWRGWQQKVLRSDISEHMYLNIDLAFTSVVSCGTLIEALGKYMSTSDITQLASNNKLKESFSEYFKGLSVMLTHLKRTKKIYGIGPATALSHTFDATIEGKEMKVNVDQYFQRVYKIKLRFPNYPLVQMAPAHKETYLPMELITIKQIQRKGLGCDIVVESMIKEAAARPEVRYDMTNKLVSENFSNQASDILKEFGLQINEGMITVNGEVISAPAIQLGKSITEFPREGKWRIQPKSHFYQPASIQSWILIDLSKSLSTRSVDEFLDALLRCASDHGMYMCKPKEIIPHEFSQIRAIKTIKEIIDKTRLDLVMYFCPNYLSSGDYGILKSIGDLLSGVVSQVILEKSVYPCKIPTINNIILKLNAKAGGINFIPTLTNDLANLLSVKEEYMLVGIDVTHPISGAKEVAVSIASVVSSIDLNGVKYTNQVVINERGNDILTTMKDNIIVALQRYNDATKKLPKRIIVFRDGLSEGQFFKARQKEVENMKAGCAIFYEKQKIKPKITFICVQKRHHTRFYTTANPPTNCPPGLVVADKNICEKDSFYLLSHTAFQGTCKASHYKVIYDENQFALNQLQKFAFFLCHIYARCTSSVSIPTPTYYAHLSAFRSNFHRAYCESYNRDVMFCKKELEKKLASETRADAQKAFYKSVLTGITPHKNLTNTMYFV